MTNLITSYPYLILGATAVICFGWGVLLMGVLAANKHMDHCDKCIALRKYVGMM